MNPKFIYAYNMVWTRRRYAILLITISLCCGLAYLGLAGYSYFQYQKAINAYHQKNFYQAEIHFLLSLKGKLNKFSSYYNLGNTYYREKKWDQALVCYEKALERSQPKDQPDTLYNLGNTYYQLQDYDQSIIYYQKTLQLDPHHLPAKHNLAVVLRLKKQTAESQSETRQAHAQIFNFLDDQDKKIKAEYQKAQSGTSSGKEEW